MRILLLALFAVLPIFAPPLHAQEIEDGGGAALTPATVDLLWESDGLVPPLYRGRSLPASGTRVRLVAIATFGQGGSAVPAKDLVYTWRKNGTVLGSVSGKGRSSIEIDAPLRFGTDTVSVEVRTPDDSVPVGSAVASTRIAVRDPAVSLYINHPLFGPLLHSAIGRTSSFSETEMSFVAIPFFAPVRNANSPALSYEWSVGGERIAADRAKPSLITIRSAGSAGSANLELLVTHATNYFFEAEGSWTIDFSQGGSAGGGSSDPFAPATSGDTP